MFHTLIVDDYAILRASVRDLLRSRFARIAVDEAGDGPEALRAIERRLPDLVLLDIKLPTGNGIELTKVIKTAHPGTRVAILTGHDLPQYRQAAFRNGADGFLYKGSTSCVDEVTALVEGVISARQTSL